MKIVKVTAIVLALIVSCLAHAKSKSAADGVSKKEYLAEVRKVLERKGREFNEKRLSARFDRMDADKDGILTDKEKKAFASKRKKDQTN